MTAPKLILPADPLDRFCRFYAALLEDASWYEGRDEMRYTALAVTPLDGEPAALARELRDLADALKAAQPWYRRTTVGLLLAAQLLRDGLDAQAAAAEVRRAGELFRARWRFHGGSHEALAILVLRAHAPAGHVTAEQVARLAAIYDEARRAHPWITNRADWPACALLATSDATPAQVGARMEAAYAALRERGLSRGDALQTAAQILFFHPDAPDRAAARCATIEAAFRAQGLWMVHEDYDEIALLAFADAPVPEVVTTVARHRARIAALPKPPGKQTAFALACGTALLELVRGSQDAQRLTQAQSVMLITHVLAVQAAAAATAAGASAASAG